MLLLGELVFSWVEDGAVWCAPAYEFTGTVVLFEGARLGVPLDLGLNLVVSWIRDGLRQVTVVEEMARVSGWLVGRSSVASTILGHVVAVIPWSSALVVFRRLMGGAGVKGDDRKAVRFDRLFEVDALGLSVREILCISSSS